MRRCSPTTLAIGLLLLASAVSGAPSKTAADPGIVSRIKRVPVESKAFAAIGYSKRLHVLEIEFRNGAIYRYLDVPLAVHKGMMNAPSKARFYHKNIRGKYRALNVRGRGR